MGHACDSLFDGLQAEFIGTAAALMPGYDYELPEGVVVTMEPECDPDLDVVLIPWRGNASLMFISVSWLG